MGFSILPTRIFYGARLSEEILGFGIQWFQTPVKQKFM